MQVSIVIPSFNGRHLLEKNLPKVFEAISNSKNNIYELIIVDDLSKDDTISFLNSNYKGKFKLVKHTMNRGFSAAVNTGVRASKGDYVLLLNTDVLPEKNFLEGVKDIFDDKNVFAVSLHEKGHGPSKAAFHDGIIDIGFNKPESSKTELTFYVSGAAGLFRKSIWQELGGLDEKLLSPFYWEDIDICYRASKRGYTNVWYSGGKVIHNHESTTSTLPKKYVARIKERNQLLMLWKNIQSKALLAKHFNYLLKRILRNPGYLLIVFMTIPRLGLLFKLRNREIKESNVSDEAVFQKYQ